MIVKIILWKLWKAETGPWCNMIKPFLQITIKQEGKLSKSKIIVNINNYEIEFLSEN